MELQWRCVCECVEIVLPAIEEDSKRGLVISSCRLRPHLHLRLPRPVEGAAQGRARRAPIAVSRSVNSEGARAWDGEGSEEGGGEGEGAATLLGPEGAGAGPGGRARARAPDSHINTSKCILFRLSSINYSMYIHSHLL